MNPSSSQVMQQESLHAGRRELIRLTNEILSGRFARGLMVDLRRRAVMEQTDWECTWDREKRAVGEVGSSGTVAS